MTKTLRNALIAIFAVLLALCSVLLLLPGFKASADVITTSDISDGNFAFVPGASVRTSLFAEGVDTEYEYFNIDAAPYSIGYYFRLEDTAYENLADQVTNYYNWWGSRADNVFVYEFTLCAGNRDGDGTGSFITDNPQISVLVVLYPLRTIGLHQTTVFYGFIAVKNYYRAAGLEDIDFFEFKNSTEDKTYSDFLKPGGKTFTVNDNSQPFGGAGYKIIQSGYLADGVSNLGFFENQNIEGLTTLFHLSVNSPFSYYYVKARYCFQTADFVGVFGTSYEQTYGEIYSSSRSVAKILENMNNAGVDFEEEFGDRATYANAILNTDATERVRVKYLEEIPGTPYATHKFAYVDVPVLSETIFITDVEEQLGKDLHKCLDANAYCFQKATDKDGDFYQLYYFPVAWLRSVTVDGNYYDYFLDLNKSYESFYMPFVNAEMLTSDVYEYVYSVKILNRFPALVDYRLSEVYGCFGLVIVPETYTFNSVLKTLFDIDTSKIGVISTFMFDLTLSGDAYQKLLTDYQYGWLNKTWATVSNSFSESTANARIYLVYSEPGTEDAIIGEGGQTDAEKPGSVFENEVVEPFGAFVSEFGSSLLDSLMSFSSFGKIALGLVLLVVLVFVFVKLFNLLFGRKRKR